jgi:type II secretory pathway component PulM
VLATARNLGMTLGVAIAAAVYASYHRGSLAGIAGWSGMRETNYILTSIAVLNLLITWLVRLEPAARRHDTRVATLPVPRQGALPIQK